MRRSGIILFLISLLIIWLILVAYLAQARDEQVRPSRIDVGIMPVFSPAGPGSFNLTTANLLASGYQFDLANETSDKEIYYILGLHVDERGNASSWIYGIRHHLGTYFLIYDRTGWTDIPWNGTLPEKQLDTDTLFSLNRLFQENRNLLVQPALPQRQVELVNNTYYISLSDGATTREYLFDARTGALIQPHEE